MQLHGFVRLFEINERRNIRELSGIPGGFELQRLPGVKEVASKFYFNADMTRFPKALNRGRQETPYGRAVRFEDLAGLERFLAAYA